MFLIDRRYIRFFDFISFFLAIIISLIGLACIYSATYKPEQPYSVFFQKQLIGIISGILIYLTCCFIDYRNLQRWSYYAYFILIALLIFTILKGSTVLGGKRWIGLWLIKVQPSELAKLCFPGFFSYYIFKEKDQFIYKFGDFLPILLFLGISFILILKQPDLGTALIILFLGMILLWLSGIGTKFFSICFFIRNNSCTNNMEIFKTLSTTKSNSFFGSG